MRVLGKEETINFLVAEGEAVAGPELRTGNTKDFYEPMVKTMTGPIIVQLELAILRLLNPTRLLE